MCPSQIEGLSVWRKFFIAYLFGTFCCWSMPQAAGAQPGAGKNPVHPARIALVIGNAGYPGAPLVNTAGDAQAIGNALRALGFEVMQLRDLDRRGMQEALSSFQRRLDAGGIGLFYFAGHGLRMNGKTLLLPVDADSRLPATLLARGIDLQSVLDSMSAQRPDKLNLVVLDTCLDTPFRSAGMHDEILPLPPAETLIAYAAAPGAPAADGLYTAALLDALRMPDEDIESLLRRVASSVAQASHRKQQPWMSSSLQGVFRLGSTETGRTLPAPEAVLAMQSRGVLPKDSAEQYELTFWESIKDSTHPGDYEAYLQAYPNGRFAALARARLERLRKAAPKVETPSEGAAPPATKTAPERPRPPKKQEQARPAPAPAPAPKAAPEQARPEPAAPPPARAPASAGVSEFKDCPTCPDMVALPPGTFSMGSTSGDPSEKPPHRVTVNTPFAIGKYEVTVAQWEACAEAGACPKIAADASRPKNTPVRDVSWDDAQQYVKWLAKLTGKPYRLPTEAEWEYAARGGSASVYWWGDQMRKGTANCKDCGNPWQADGPAPVGSFAANPYGLFDMNGSVWEWVNDCWHNSYKGAPADGHSWEEANCRVRVIRGGSWREGASYMPSSTRFKYDASVRHSQNGFRVARDNK
jgi:formylglycine-generating enzyme required for sulfatase activity